MVKCCRATSQEIEPSDGLGGDLLITFRVRGPTDPRPVSLLVESVAERSGDSGADASKRLRLGNRVCDAGNQAVRSSSGCLAIVALGVSPGGSAKVEPMAEVVRTTAPRTRWVFLSRDACHLGLCRLVALARPTQEHSTEYARSGPTLVSVASRVHVRFVQAVAPMPATAVDVVAGWWSRTVHRWCGQLCLRHTLEGALTRSCILSTGCRRFLKSEHDGKTWLCARPSCCIIHNSNNNMAAELPTATGGEARASPGTAAPPPRDRPGRPLPGSRPWPRAQTRTLRRARQLTRLRRAMRVFPTAGLPSPRSSTTPPLREALSPPPPAWTRPQALVAPPLWSAKPSLTPGGGLERRRTFRTVYRVPTASQTQRWMRRTPKDVPRAKLNPTWRSPCQTLQHMG